MKEEKLQKNQPRISIGLEICFYESKSQLIKAQIAVRAPFSGRIGSAISGTYITPAILVANLVNIGS
jgi:membrane fusion protein (multidrug efflux system)